MTEPIAIHWFRQDLRLADNPALTHAASHGAVLPIYILDDINAGAHALGGASRCWLHHSLTALDSALGGKLSVYCGDPKLILDELRARHKIAAVCWNRCYQPWQISRDTSIKHSLRQQGVAVHTYNGSLLWEPWTVLKADKTPYRVFTPFYRKGCLSAPVPRPPLPQPRSSGAQFIADPNRQSIAELGLLPKLDWGERITEHWRIGEAGAHARFAKFIEQGLHSYRDGRNLPAKPYVSRLSPHLRFGEISPNQLWHTVRSQGDDQHIDTFCSELGWREFSYSQLYHNPSLPQQNLQKKFDHFPWVDNATQLRAWQQGQTGIPLVDAGMRELWQTGYMHNRVRMVVGSFLVKNLRLHWQHGERWFWDTLFDADLANNSASWQWIAGCGADAAPYFRIFNPITQGEKFDPDAAYLRNYLPELANLPNKYLFNPQTAPEHILSQAKVRLGIDYPNPIVDLKQSRQDALEAFKSLSESAR